MDCIAWLQQILNRIGKNDDAASMSDTLFAGQQAIYDELSNVGADISVPAADSSDNVDVADVIGNKTDTPVEAVGTMKSLMAYIKGLIQELDQRSTPKFGYGTTTSTGWADVVNITDKGVLTGIAAYIEILAGNEKGVEVNVVIDGSTELTTNNNGIGCYMANDTNRAAGMTASIPCNHRFNTSLRVQIRVNSLSGGGTPTAYGIVSYTTDA